MKAQSSPASEKEAQPAAVALFVSDIHLNPESPATTRAFLAFLNQHATHAHQLYLLGDVFEYWAGDDDADDPFHQMVITALREVSDAGAKVFWIAGNRDFLVGETFARQAGLTLLDDPHVIELCHQRIVLTHGDASCTDDAAYMAFRRQVRDVSWQKNFLSQSLDQRKQIVASMRMGSKQAQQSKSMDIMDVNSEAVATLLDSSDASVMIHGHTHRPAEHELVVAGRACVRHVLPDWDCDAEMPRGGWISMDQRGHLQRFDPYGQSLP